MAKPASKVMSKARGSARAKLAEIEILVRIDRDVVRDGGGPWSGFRFECMSSILICFDTEYSGADARASVKQPFVGHGWKMGGSIPAYAVDYGMVARAGGALLKSTEANTSSWFGLRGPCRAALK